MREPDDVTPCDAAEITHWDATADVVVVGFGAAGSVAAFSAAEAGAEVLVAERTGGAGGAAALAEGIVYLGGGTPIQRACGFEDSLEDMYRYMMAACGPDPDEAKIARYVEESLGHFEWLVARGVPFDPTFCAETQMAPTGTEGLVYSGGEDAYPFNEIARPAPRGHLAKTKRSTGWLLMEHLARAATQAGAVVSCDTRIDRLVLLDGAVVGVQGQRFGETVSLRARRGVVLTAGGFVFNDEMLRKHCPPLVRGTFKVGTEGDDGRGIRMAQAIGASLRNMYAGEVSLPIIPPRKLVHGILVDGRGQRFINEDTYMGRVGQAALYEHDGEAYLIVDEACYEPNWMGLAASWVCATPAELESEMGLPPDRSKPRSSSTTATPPGGRTRCSTRGGTGCAHSSPRSAPSTCASARRPTHRSPWAGSRPVSRVPSWTSRVIRSAGSTRRGAPRRGCARSATPAGCPSATARSSGAWPVPPPPPPRAPSDGFRSPEGARTGPPPRAVSATGAVTRTPPRGSPRSRGPWSATRSRMAAGGRTRS